MTEKVELDAVIIGGGVIGLATAFKLAQKFPELDIAILESGPYFGDQTTGRNSGVLHAGIYYPKNSLKNRFCLTGLEAWYDFASKYKIPHLRCGKYIVAGESSEDHLLDSLFEKATDAGARDLRFAENSEIETLSSQVHISKAIFSPHTGVIDVAQAMKTLLKLTESHGVSAMKNHHVRSIEKSDSGFLLSLENLEISTKLCFNCAGLRGIDLRKTLSLTNLENLFVKGVYLTTNQKLGYKSLLYPMPLEKLKGLGVHATIEPDGKIKFGPNAFEVDQINYNIEDKDYFELMNSVKFFFKGVDESRCHPDFSGIRPKILDNGALHPDFWVKTPADLNIEGYFECCGIESPGLTSAFSIADYLVDSINV
ncbi:MAG: FAD-dependent oxidoreductase [Bacteriovoracaceae bacterium]|jgi:L-2-hydroxyglutarate oxidase LhgO|nr:FAD-dependent oxidoreductase [Bacteriovoracaceae bacterium]